MAGTTGTNIIDAMIAAYRPITGRLLKRYRDNMYALNWRPLIPDRKSSHTIAGPASWTTIRTIRLFVADVMVGPSGTLFHYRVQTTLDHGSSMTGEFRILVDGNASNTDTRTVGGGGGSDTSNPTFEVTAVVTGNTVIDVEFQVIGSGADDLTMEWDDESYLAAAA